MKHFYLFLCLIFACFVNGQIINFPDPNFKAKLLQPNVAFFENGTTKIIDANNNGEIEVSEVQNITDLDVSNSKISDLTGISYFTSLSYLDCSRNLLTNLTIDNAITFRSLSANNNFISSISVNFESIVGILNLSYNNLSSFSADGINFIDNFDLSHNQLSNLSFNNCDFYYLSIDYNNLTSIQFAGSCSIYKVAGFTNNLFSLLDLKDIDFGRECTLYLGNNTIDNVLFDNYYPNPFSPFRSQPGNIYYSSNNTFFDLGNFNRITDCEPEDTGHLTIENCPNLSYFILKNGFNHTEITCIEGGDIFQNPALSLSINNCPNLSFICVDELEKPYIQSTITLFGLKDQVVVNSDCASSVLETEKFVAEEQFTIYPVPAHSILQITTKNTLVINGIEIYNNLGQIIHKEDNNNRNIDVSKLLIGSYFLKIKTENGLFVKQFLKK